MKLTIDIPHPATGHINSHIHIHEIKMTRIKSDNQPHNEHIVTVTYTALGVTHKDVTVDHLLNTISTYII